MVSAEELKVYALGGRRVVFVRAGWGEELRDHLSSRGFPARVALFPVFDRLELELHAHVGEAQAALDDWPP
jgi:hypothetical protein